MISENITKTVEYENLENLAEFPQDFHYEAFFKGIKNIIDDESQWLAQFEGMNDVRRFQKFFGEKSFYLLKECFPNIIKLTASIRSNLSKLALMTTKEFFLFHKYNHCELELIKKIIFAVLVQSASTKVFIKEEALSCLEQVVSNESFCNLEIVSILLEEISNKNLTISENACSTAEKLIKKIPDINIISHSKENYLGLVLNQVVNLFLLKKDNYSKKALRTFDLIYEIVGKDGLENFLNHSSVKNLKITLEEMHKVILSKKKSKPQTGSIKEVIRQKINKAND